MKNNLKIIILSCFLWRYCYRHLHYCINIFYSFFSSFVIPQSKVKVLAKSLCDKSVFLETALVKLQK